MTNTNETPFEIIDLSGAVQRDTTEFLQKPNEVNLAVNASFGRIGGVEKSSGYTQIGNTITTSSSSTSTSTSTSSSTSTSTSTSSTTTP